MNEKYIKNNLTGDSYLTCTCLLVNENIEITEGPSRAKRLSGLPFWAIACPGATVWNSSLFVP